MSNGQRIERRKRKYNLLKAAGFSYKEANLYKDYSNYRIAQLCAIREKYNPRIDREYQEMDREIQLIIKRKMY